MLTALHGTLSSTLVRGRAGRLFIRRHAPSGSLAEPADELPGPYPAERSSGKGPLGTRGVRAEERSATDRPVILSAGSIARGRCSRRWTDRSCRARENRLRRPVPLLMLSIIMPVYNEAHTVDEIVGRAMVACSVAREMIIVTTPQETLPRRAKAIAEERGDEVRVFSQTAIAGREWRFGPGSRTRGEIILIQDADPSTIPATTHSCSSQSWGRPTWRSATGHGGPHRAPLALRRQPVPHPAYQRATAEPRIWRSATRCSARTRSDRSPSSPTGSVSSRDHHKSRQARLPGLRSPPATMVGRRGG